MLKGGQNPDRDPLHSFLNAIPAERPTPKGPKYENTPNPTASQKCGNLVPCI